MMRPILGAYVVIGVAIVYQTFARLGDNSAAAHWSYVVLYVGAVLFPAWWAGAHLRAFRKLGLPLTRELRMRAWSPVMIGITTLATGIGLILRAAGIWR